MFFSNLREQNRARQGRVREQMQIVEVIVTTAFAARRVVHQRRRVDASDAQLRAKRTAPMGLRFRFATEHLHQRLFPLCQIFVDGGNHFVALLLELAPQKSDIFLDTKVLNLHTKQLTPLSRSCSALDLGPRHAAARIALASGWRHLEPLEALCPDADELC